MGVGTTMTKISKYLSYILRHKPDAISLVLDENGWADIDELIAKTKDFELTKDMIYEVVKASDKQRFIIKNNKIRANQGHSINIDLNLNTIIPPAILYHGTTIKYIDAIMAEGIKPMSRQYVHLSKDIQTAKTVGARHGKPEVLKIDCQAMYQDGYKFYLSENGIWLTEYVSNKYINR